MWSDEEHASDYAAESDNDGTTERCAIISDPEVWMDYYSEELLDLWYYLKERCDGLGYAILDRGTFPDFAQFCFAASSGHPPRA